MNLTFDENNKIRQSTKVNINDLVWDVDIVSSDDESLTLGGRQCRGATWCGQQRIVLSAMLNQRTARLEAVRQSKAQAARDAEYRAQCERDGLTPEQRRDRAKAILADVAAMISLSGVRRVYR